jgi:hypothetical protein
LFIRTPQRNRPVSGGYDALVQLRNFLVMFWAGAVILPAQTPIETDTSIRALDQWSSVESGGALVASDNRSLRIPAPSDINTRPVHGEGWTLQLAPGWTISKI